VRRLRRAIPFRGRLGLARVLDAGATAGGLRRVAMWRMLFEVVTRRDRHTAPQHRMMSGVRLRGTFDRDLAIELRLLRAIDLAHPSDERCHAAGGG
jgi:hypothetical protein